MALIGVNITLHILAFGLGAATLFLAAVYHVRKDQPWTKYYLLFQSSITLILVLNFIRIFVTYLVPQQPAWVLMIFLALLYANLAFLIIFIPYFTTWIIAHPWRRPYKAGFIAISSVFFVFAVLNLIFQAALWIEIVLVTIFFGVLLFSIGVLMKNLSSINNRDVIRICRAYIMLSLVMIPFMIFDTFFAFPTGFVTLPIYYFWFSLIICIYLVSYFLHIPEAPDDQIDQLQLKKFRITEREAEIIELIRQGDTNREIGEKLFISHYTVNNHIANIYDKTGVRSRIDLLNLMRPRL